jgi:small RNA 2'-O-methyltransferase
VSGLDISAPDLQFTIANTAPVKGVCRWEPLEANVWQGGLEAFNPQFVDVECIVATEVYVCARSFCFF